MVEKFRVDDVVVLIETVCGAVELPTMLPNDKPCGLIRNAKMEPLWYS